MQVRCPHCRETFQLSGPQLERQVACPSCGHMIDRGKIETLTYDETPAPRPEAPAAAGADRSPMALSPGIFDSAIRTQEYLKQDLPLDPGMLVGPYRVLEFIGRGGMGAVYKALQPNLDRVVALKVLPYSLARDPDFVTRFNREAKTLANLNHPNIVAIYDMGHDAGVYYFVMEYVDGVTLRHVLRERKLSGLEALKIVPQLCDALEYAHVEGVIHRDIKPENILVDRKGRIRIADFGLARIVKGDQAVDPVTRTNMIMGTLEYMAPEQRESAKTVDHRADIYSLGVVLYEMLTGELPVGRWDPPSRRSKVDLRVDDVVARSLERDPARRYQRAGHLATDIHALSPSSVLPAGAPREAAAALAAWFGSRLGAEGFQSLGALDLPRLRVEAAFQRAEPAVAASGEAPAAPAASRCVAVLAWPVDRRLDPVNLRSALREGAEGLAGRLAAGACAKAGAGTGTVGSKLPALSTFVVLAAEPLPAGFTMEALSAAPAAKPVPGAAPAAPAIAALLVDLASGEVLRVGADLDAAPRARAFLDDLDRQVRAFLLERSRPAAAAPPPPPPAPSPAPAPVQPPQVNTLWPVPPVPPVPPPPPARGPAAGAAMPAAFEPPTAELAPAPEALKARWFGLLSFLLPSAALFLFEHGRGQDTAATAFGGIFGAVALLKGRKTLRVLRVRRLGGLEPAVAGMALASFFPLLWLLAQVVDAPDQTLWLREAAGVSVLCWAAMLGHLLFVPLARYPSLGDLRPAQNKILWTFLLLVSLQVPVLGWFVSAPRFISNLVDNWSALPPWTLLVCFPVSAAYWFFVVKRRSVTDLVDLLAGADAATPRGANGAPVAFPTSGAVAPFPAPPVPPVPPLPPVVRRLGAAPALGRAPAPTRAGVDPKLFQPQKALLEFLGHLGSYLIVVSGLLVLNLVTSPRHLWVVWVAGPWGLGLAFHLSGLCSSLVRARYSRAPGAPPFTWQHGTPRPFEVPAYREEMIGFFEHLGSFFLVNAFLAFVNFATGSDSLWFLWSVGPWGVGVLFHLQAILLKAVELRLLPSKEANAAAVAAMPGGQPVPPAAWPGEPIPAASGSPVHAPADAPAPVARPRLSFFSYVGCLSLLVGLPLLLSLAGLTIGWIALHIPAFRDHIHGGQGVDVQRQVLEPLIGTCILSFAFSLWLLFLHRVGSWSFASAPGRLRGFFPIRWSGRVGLCLLVLSLGLGISLFGTPEARPMFQAVFEAVRSGTHR
ncbi:MAG: protein kinase [Planctomycetes bacterium]|nr:protein kinase [Planctomycetota bacterium]